MAEDGIPPEKLAEYKKTFALFDKNRDGFITSEELGVVMRSLGKHPTNEHLASIVDQVGKRKKGSVDFPEFIHIMSKDDNPITEDDLVAAFKVFDKDGNGFMNAAELKNVMTSMGETFTEDEVDEMIKEADTNGDGQIDYKEFSLLMSN